MASEKKLISYNSKVITSVITTLVLGPTLSVHEIYDQRRIIERFFLFCPE